MQNPDKKSPFNPEEDLTPRIVMQCHCKLNYRGSQQCPYFKAACPNYLQPMTHDQFRDFYSRQGRPY